jgi:hypothetical protein
MLEDYWMPRREGRGTEIETLDGAQNLGETSDVTLFQDKFYKSLNVPQSRFSPDQASNMIFGRAADIARDEFRFKKFINKLRQRFNPLFEDILQTQLILKNIILPEEWDMIKRDIVWVYNEDNNYVQYKETELLNAKLESLNALDPFVGKYFDKDYVLRTVMKFTDKDLENMNLSTEKEDKAALEAEYE